MKSFCPLAIFDYFGGQPGDKIEDIDEILNA